MVVELAELCGWMVYHVTNVKGQLRNSSSVGFPDLVLVRDRVLFRELKTGRNRTTEAQDLWIASLGKAEANVGVWTPGDWDEIQETLMHPLPDRHSSPSSGGPRASV